MQLHVPAAMTVAVHAAVLLPSMKTEIVAPTSPVPVMVGVVGVINAEAAGVLMTGTAGAMESMLNATGVDSGDALPAASVARDVNE